MFTIIVCVIAVIVVTTYFITLRKSAKNGKSVKDAARRSDNPKSVKNVTAYVSAKVDERKRRVDENGGVVLSKELYQAVFRLSDGNILQVEVTRKTWKDLPFAVKGMLTYKNGKFISFKYKGGIIED